MSNGLTRTGIPYLTDVFNAAAGCSAGCPYCYVRRIAHRLPCPQCRTGEPHMHRTRLEAFADSTERMKPRVIGVSFTGELFDPLRLNADIEAVVRACDAHPQHAYVYLTKRPAIMEFWATRERTNCWFGVSVDGAAATAMRLEWLARLGRHGVNTWLSVEPWSGHGLDLLQGIIGGRTPPQFVAIGSESGPGARLLNGEGRRRWWRAADALVEGCRAARVPVWVKQMPIHGPRGYDDTVCSHEPGRGWPPGLRIRDLPPGRWGEILGNAKGGGA